jgi:predicted amidohydrolase YtcJ
VQQGGQRQHRVLRPRHEAEGSEAAPVVGLTPADWLLGNARVITFDPARPFADAIAVRGGRVLAIGRGAELRRLAGPQTEQVDCRGATILPGLIDPHLHLFALAARDAHLDCGGASSIAALGAAVRAHAARLAPGEWLRGEGLDEGVLGRLPTAAELDRASPANPVRLRHRSRHASVLSGGALARLGARGGDGLVAGREATLNRLVGALPAGVLEDGLTRAAAELAAVGLTTVADATPRARSRLGPLRAVMAAGRFPLHVHAMRPPGSAPWPAVGRLHCGAVKLLVEDDGRRLRPRPAVLRRRVAMAVRADAQVAVHCVGAATLVAALAAFAALPSRLRARRRHRLEHVAECPPPLVARIAALGLVVVTNPAFIHWRGDAYRAETDGPARGWLYRARSLAAAGVRLAGASDAPVVPPSPWTGVAAARSRRTATGATLGGGARLDAAAALGLFTTGAAHALGDDRIGRLVEGGPAHIAVVEPDPLRAPADEVAATRVCLTLVDGTPAWPR